MRVVIVGPAKSGANRLRCLLATAYGLRAIDARDAPAACEQEEMASWLRKLPDDSVTHTSLRFNPTLQAAVADLGATFVVIVRHPFDLFVSIREVQLNRERRATRRSRARDAIDLEQSARLTSTMRDPFGTYSAELESLINWASIAAVTVRYEDFVQNPDATLAEIAAIVGPLDEDTILHAVRLCPAEQLIVSSGNRGARMAEIAPGAWRTEIEPATLSQLQREYTPALVTLGFDPALTTST